MKIRPNSRQAFTLVELLVTIAVLSLLMTMVADVIGRTQSVVSQAKSRAESFQEARAAFEAMSSNVSQANLEAVWGYHWNTSVSNSVFKRESDQHFVLGPNSELLAGNSEKSQAVFFQAPLGFAGLAAGETGVVANQLRNAHEILNCWGYYIAYGSDLDQRPEFLRQSPAIVASPERWRFRLMEFRLPAEKSTLYSMNLGDATSTTAYNWFRGPFPDNSVLADHSTPIADNVLAMILVPYSVTSVAEQVGGGTTQFVPEPNYRYDTRKFQWTPADATAKRMRHQLPAMIQVSLVVTDEPSYQRFEEGIGGHINAAASIREVFNGRFANHAQHDADMAAVEEALVARNLTYKVLSTSVALRGAKWITDQEL